MWSTLRMYLCCKDHIVCICVNMLPAFALPYRLCWALNDQLALLFCSKIWLQKEMYTSIIYTYVHVFVCLTFLFRRNYFFSLFFFSNKTKDLNSTEKKKEKNNVDVALNLSNVHSFHSFQIAVNNFRHVFCFICDRFIWILISSDAK